MKKLLITSALVGSLFSGAAIAETKIGGKLEVTYADQTTDAAQPKYQGAAIGYDYTFTIDSKKELSNGWTGQIKVSAVSDDADTAANDSDSGTSVGAGAGMFQDGGLYLSNGNTTLYVGQDGMTAYDNIVVPKAYALMEDNASVANVGNTGTGTVHDNNAFGISQKAAGGAFTALYVPQIGHGTGQSDQAVAGVTTSGSGYELGYSGSLNVEGLAVTVAVASAQSSQTNVTADTDAKKLGVAYKLGNFAAGFDLNRVDGPTAATTLDINTFGISYKVSDSVTVAGHYAEAEVGGSNNDEEVIGFEVGYNLGAAVVAFSYQEGKNLGGSASTEGESYVLTFSQAF
jgi:hypothetical protein